MISATVAQADLFYNETRSPKTFMLSKWYNDLAGNPVRCSLTVPSYASKILLPANSPQLSIQADAPIAHADSPISITLTVRNTGSATANNLLITNTLPISVFYLSGGTRVGDVLELDGRQSGLSRERNSQFCHHNHNHCDQPGLWG